LKISSAEFRTAPLPVLHRIDSVTSRFLVIYVDGVVCVYLNDPRLIAAVLETHWSEFRKEFGYKKSRDMIAADLFSPQLVWPNAEEFGRIAIGLKDLLARHVAKAGPKVSDLYRWCRHLTMAIFRGTLFEGSIKSSITNEELEEATLQVIRELGRVILEFPHNIDVHDQVDAATHEVFRNYKRLFQRNCECRHATPGRAMTTLLAGYEQMASIMYWTIVHYAEHSLHGHACANKRHFVDEVIRLHSPIWTIMRRPKSDVTIGEFVLKKDSVVITSPWLMGRHPVYFPDPEKFDPERWNNPIEKFAFFPFSHGPRVCKAEHFVRTALACLLVELESRDITVSRSDFGEECHNIRVSATPLYRRSMGFT
jgi:hypothetical protein